MDGLTDGRITLCTCEQSACTCTGRPTGADRSLQGGRKVYTA